MEDTKIRQSPYQKPLKQIVWPSRSLVVVCVILASVYVVLCRVTHPSDIFSSGPMSRELNLAILRSKLKKHSFRDDLVHWKNIHIAMFATESNERFCKTLFSTLVNGYDAPHIIHYQQNLTHGHGEKIYKYEKYLHDLPTMEDTIILLVDAFDVWFQLPETHMLHRFEEFSSDLLVGADKKCWPQKPDHPTCTKWPQALLQNNIYGDYTDDPHKWMVEYARPRWLNSGTLLGTHKALLETLSIAARMAYMREEDSFHDQELIADALVKDDLDFHYSVDSVSSIFQTLTFSHQDTTWEVNPSAYSPPSTPYREDQGEDSIGTIHMQHVSDLDLLRNPKKSFWYNRPLLRNKISNTIPAVLHFNGRKKYMDWWWKRMWFSVKGTREALIRILYASQGQGQAGAWDGEKWRPWEDLCGSIDLF